VAPKEKIPKLLFIQEPLFFKKTIIPNPKAKREIVEAKIKFKIETAKPI